MRHEFEMTAEQEAKLLEAMRPVPMIMLQCGTPPSQQENANRAWKELGIELGFDGMTVEPSRKGQRFFTAEALEGCGVCGDHHEDAVPRSCETGDGV